MGAARIGTIQKSYGRGGGKSEDKKDQMHARWLHWHSGILFDELGFASTAFGYIEWFGTARSALR